MLFCTILRYSSKVLAWIHAVPFVRTVKQGKRLRLVNISRRYNAVVQAQLATGIAKQILDL